MTVETPTLSDLVAEIEREIEVLNASAALNRRDEKRHAGTPREPRSHGRALAYEGESRRLAAILAKYQAVEA